MIKNIKVCIIAPVHIYTDVRVFQKEAKTLSYNGYDVTLLAKKDSKEIVDNIRIIPVPKYKNRFQRFLIQPWIIYKVLVMKPEIIHLHNPETLLIGFIFKCFGKKVIYDTHEDFTKKILIKTWLPKLLRNTVAQLVVRVERLATRFFDGIICTQDDVAERLGKKATVIENAPISKGLSIDLAYKLSDVIVKEECFRAIYIGGLSKSRGLFNMIEAIKLVNNRIKCRLWLAGPILCAEEMEKAQALSGWKFVDYLGDLPQANAFSYVIKSNVGLITILSVGGYDKTNPNKLFEYQLFSKPFIASNFELWQKQLGKVKAGLFVNPDNPNDIANAVIYLATNATEAAKMGERGKNYIVNPYNWEKESQKLIDLYNFVSSRL